MYADQKQLLDQLITAVTNWRNTANGFGIDLNQVNFVLPEGQPVQFIWDTTVSKFKIVAAAQ